MHRGGPRLPAAIERFKEVTCMPSLLQPFVGDLDGLPRMVGTPAHPALMRMDAWRDGDTFVAELDLPGIKADSLDVTVESGVLTVRAERREPGDGTARG
ncbi:18 kDa heat shock protein [Mycobacterium xenopi 3993]|nr:18 kDa heat shock protein [Mycobacterium xenopi 3993]